MGNNSERYFYVQSVISEYERYKTKEQPNDGYALERFTISNLCSFFKTKPGIDIVSGTHSDDKERGTDFFVYLADYPKPIRCDFTLNFDGKDHMPLVSKYDVELTQQPLINDHTIHFGVRTGNNTADFNEPVIVVGMNIPPSEIKDEIYASYDNDLPYKHAIDHMINGEAVICDDKGKVINTQHSLYALIESVDQTYRALLAQRFLSEQNIKKLAKDYDNGAMFHQNPRMVNNDFLNNLDNLKFKDLPDYENDYDDGCDFTE